jgi:parallel beta-helix repeat protein
MRLRRVFAGLLGVAFLALLATTPALGAKPVVVSCGQVITKDTKLANDLTNCPGIGLTVGADDVTLDLNGHAVDGNGVADSEGIQVNGHNRATVQHGTVTDFVEGVAVLFSTGTRVSDLSVSRQRHAAVFVSDSSNVSVERTASTEIAFAALFTTRSHGIRFERNSVSASGEGIAARVSDHLLIARNSLSGNTGGAGIDLFEDVDDSTVERNVLTGNGDGIALADGSERNLATRNSASGSGAGALLINAGSNRIEDNTLSDNVFAGLVVIGSDDNRIERNSIARNGHDPDAEGGIHVISNDDGSTSDRNAIARNDLIGNAPDGLLVDPGQTATLVNANRADRNADDGIDVDAPGTRVTGNTANRNGDLGIEAVAGVIDGGGNRAGGNGNPLQCTNVFCKSG